MAVRLWFYVPDYPLVKERLEAAYEEYDVLEWSAEPGRVGGCPDDADITISGLGDNLSMFVAWLKTSKIAGLMIEGSLIR